ncbi:putative aspartyl aminopeptidase protein [Phaeoacremonium minimum UCRPA7]|uniref:aspartyl aminopeptidase n=1 Tax=Phaeoacremonium minimum (strain UCR-PA7) TaxID=1286976 RepID=R8BUL2_PHAM7|nr:putative aspartyl aminopeptidase protein [Phaeoacremonium minimum UCRPA7]EOO03052.1 putative aspartyl aminopeptidase protein [Phaeoacremonium minimum UCRPA7]
MAPPKSAHEFVDFVNASPTPYHAVASAVERLEAAGFKNIKERDSWSSALRPGGKYYLTRNGSSIVAFAIGAKWKPGNPIAMVGAHTDSPCLRLKPVSKKTNAGFLQVGVETYGGGIWHSWFDRDLSIAGRVLVKDSKGDFTQKLIKVDKPILRIPTLAIHLDRSPEFNPNKETELFPIAGLVAAELNRTGKEEAAKDEDADSEDFKPLKAMAERHHPYLLDIIAEHVGVETEHVVDFELVLYDTQKSCLGGLNDEFIFSARLDNLGMTYCSIMGLIESVKSTNLDDETSIRLITCFDHEEIGSTSAHGANSNLLPAVIRRLCVLPAGGFPGPEDASSDKSYDHADADAEVATAYEQTCSSSFLVSADMAHSVNPNYSGKYESNHQPEMNKGTVLKINANQRYATNSPGIVLLQETAKLAGVPLQLFVVRNDSPCGSTIGPMLSAKMGVRTLDLGNPQLSMHSIRETGGSYDVEHGIKLFSSFLSHYSALESKILVD